MKDAFALVVGTLGEQGTERCGGWRGHAHPCAVTGHAMLRHSVGVGAGFLRGVLCQKHERLRISFGARALGCGRGWWFGGGWTWIVAFHRWCQCGIKVRLCVFSVVPLTTRNRRTTTLRNFKHVSDSLMLRQHVLVIANVLDRDSSINSKCPSPVNVTRRCHSAVDMRHAGLALA